MLVYRYELRRYRKYILTWSLSLAFFIFVMTPVYNRMVSSASSISDRFGKGGFLTTLGVSLEYLKTPIGMYAFLTSFLMLAGGIFGMHMGLLLFTKECTQGTAEYLYTKPITRGHIFRAKVLCLFTGILFMGLIFLLASLATMTIFQPGYAMKELLLLALSLPLHALCYGALGLLFGILWQKNRSPLLTASLTVFIGYCITAFARTVSVKPLSYLSPFSFFEPVAIHELGRYEYHYFLWYLILLAGFVFAASHFLKKNDIQLVG